MLAEHPTIFGVQMPRFLGVIRDLLASALARLDGNLEVSACCASREGGSWGGPWLGAAIAGETHISYNVWDC